MKIICDGGSSKHPRLGKYTDKWSGVESLFGKKGASSKGSVIHSQSAKVHHFVKHIICIKKTEMWAKRVRKTVVGKVGRWVQL